MSWPSREDDIYLMGVHSFLKYNSVFLFRTIVLRLKLKNIFKKKKMKMSSTECITLIELILEML